jgi:hypothetical protein
MVQIKGKKELESNDTNKKHHVAFHELRTHSAIKPGLPDNTGRRQIPPWNNFYIFLFLNNLQTWMCKQNVYIALRLDDNGRYVCWMTQKNRNLVLGQVFVTFIYVLRGFRTSDDAFRLSYSIAFDCSIRPILDLLPFMTVHFPFFPVLRGRIRFFSFPQISSES